MVAQTLSFHPCQRRIVERSLEREAEALHALGFTGYISCAPTARGAWMLAKPIALLMRNRRPFMGQP